MQEPDGSTMPSVVLGVVYSTAPVEAKYKRNTIAGRGWSRDWTRGRRSGRRASAHGRLRRGRAVGPTLTVTRPLENDFKAAIFPLKATRRSLLTEASLSNDVEWMKKWNHRKGNDVRDDLNVDDVADAEGDGVEIELVVRQRQVLGVGRQPRQ